jgi:proteasome accessory factor BC
LPGTAEAGTLDQVLASVRTVAGDMVWLSDCVKVELVAGTPVDTLAQLQSFVNASHAAAIDYLVASRDEVTHRVIEPRRLFSVDSVWYVQAWCRQAGAERNFRVGNITSLVDTGETFAHREDDGDRGRAGVYTPGTEDIEVRLAVDAGTAERLADAYGATRSLLPDGRVGLSIMVGSPGTIPALMARLGGAAAVAAPEDLAAASREFLRQALDGYAGRSGIRTPA